MLTTLATHSLWGSIHRKALRVPPITEEGLQLLLEDDLRQDIIAPLLSALGLQGVFHWHGGPSELGKDFVAWHADPLGSRKNIAVIAKVTPLSTNTQLSDLSAQISQAFTASFRDPITGDTEYVHDCWIVTNKRLAPVTRDRIWATVPPEKHRNIRLIDAEQLWSLVEKHLSPALPQLLAITQEQITNLDTDFDVEVSVSKSERRVEARGRAGEESSENNKFGVSLRFADTTEGRAKRAEWEAMFRSGSPASAAGDILQEFELPDAIQDLAKQVLGMEHGVKFDSIEVSPVAGDVVTPVIVEVTTEDGGHFVLPQIDLRLSQGGSEELTFTNEHQQLPILVTLTVNHAKMGIHLNVARKGGPISATLFRSLVEFVRAMKQAGDCTITVLNPGLVLSKSSRQATAPVTESDAFALLVADLAGVQMKLNQPIIFPDRDITDEEWKTIDHLRSIHHRGQVTGSWETGTMTVAVKDIASLLEDVPEGEARPLSFDEVERLQVFESELVLHVRRTVASAILTNRDELTAIIAASPNGDDLATLRWRAGDDAATVGVYVDWFLDEPVASAE